MILQWCVHGSRCLRRTHRPAAPIANGKKTVDFGRVWCVTVGSSVCDMLTLLVGEAMPLWGKQLSRASLDLPLRSIVSLRLKLLQERKA